MTNEKDPGFSVENYIKNLKKANIQLYEDIAKEDAIYQWQMFFAASMEAAKISAILHQKFCEINHNIKNDTSFQDIVSAAFAFRN